MRHEELAVLFLALAVPRTRLFGFLEQVVRALQRIFEEAFVAVQQHEVELNFNTIRKGLCGLLEVLPGKIVLHLATIDLAQPQ